MYGRNSVFEKIVPHINKEGYLLYDGNWKHYSGITNDDVDTYFYINKQYKEQYSKRYQIPPFNEATNYSCNSTLFEYLPQQDLKTYILYIVDAGRFVCLMSGGSIVSAALMREAVVIDNDKTSKYYKFPQINKYLSDVKAI
jgi:hypothetical protein